MERLLGPWWSSGWQERLGHRLEGDHLVEAGADSVAYHGNSADPVIWSKQLDWLYGKQISSGGFSVGWRRDQIVILLPVRGLVEA